MSKNAVIFDLDGTLWDTTESTYKSVNIVTKKYNISEVTKETICEAFGFNRKEAAQKYFPKCSTIEALKLLDEISETNIKNLEQNGGDVYKNVKEAIKKLKIEYELYIVSNSGHTEYIEAFLTTSGLKSYFSGFIAASKLKLTKSDAIKKVIIDNNIENAVYVGDTKKDMQAANEADILFIHARYGFGKDLDTRVYINDISELYDVVKKYFNN